MDQIKASNATFLDDNTGGKGKYFRARILQAGLVKYSFGVCLLEKDAIDKFVYGFVGCPVIIDHKDVTNENAKEERVGVISRVWFEQMDGWYWVEGIIFDEKAISLINDGYNVSCQYEISEYANNVGKKLHNGNPFDKVILNGKPEHLAIVKNPRYENAMIAVNALEVAMNKDDEKGRWITIKGTHVFIKDGQSVEDAMSETFGQKGEQLTSQQIAHRKGGLLSEIDRAQRVGLKDKEKKLRDRYDKLRSQEAEIRKKAEALKGKYAEEDADFDIDQLEKDIATVQRYGYEEVEDIAEFLGLDEDEVRETLSAGKEKAGDFDRDDYRKFLEKEKAEKEKPSEKKMSPKAERIQKAKDIFKKDYLLSTSDEDLQRYLDHDYDSGFITEEQYRYLLDNWETLQKNIDDEINKSKAKNSIIQAINEIKETDMFKNLFKKKENKMDKDELKSLFMECLSELTAKNEADEKKEDDKLADEEIADNEDDMKDEKKDEKKADNKCKNEVVDKRDIIRQIMAIAGKEEASEDVKTIAKLAEKLAYDKSEADKKADNKCKNEDGKDDDKKVENEEKEDVKEKASNSLDEIIGKMSAGTFERKSEGYLTQKKAVELGDKLF